MSNQTPTYPPKTRSIWQVVRVHWTGTVHRHGGYVHTDRGIKVKSACGSTLYEPSNNIRADFLNRDTTKPCKRCWEVSDE